jgi:hypothetical protein
MKTAFNIFVVFTVSVLLLAAFYLNGQPAIAPSGDEGLVEIFYGEGFTLRYPSYYTESDRGLWSGDRYVVSQGPEIPHDALNYPYENIVRVSPDIELTVNPGNSDCFIAGQCIAAYQEVETVQLGENTFIKITGCDEVCSDIYFTKDTNPTVGIWVLSRFYDPIVEQILSTLTID